MGNVRHSEELLVDLSERIDALLKLEVFGGKLSLWLVFCQHCTPIGCAALSTSR